MQDAKNIRVRIFLEVRSVCLV